MKTKNLLSFLMLLTILCAFGQKPAITLTYTANNNGQHVPLNSILIENLTQGGDTILYTPDTLLLLDMITSVDKNLAESTFSLSQNYPNPFTDQTTIKVYLSEQEYLNITIRDILGRELLKYKNLFSRGDHAFTFYSGNKLYYLLTVTGKQSSQTIKLLHKGNHISHTSICRLVHNEISKGIGYKSQESVNEFEFDLGDELKYTAYSDLGERYLTDAPVSDTTYTFQYYGNPCPDDPTMADIDGNIYNTALIGSQCWMAENLKTTTYQNGVPIPNVTNNGEWSNLTTGAYVWYDNNFTWKEPYGALYNWYAVVDPNGLCPEGWHVPEDEEWTVLTDYIGGTVSPFGNELKSCRQINSPLTGDCNIIDHPRWEQHSTHYGTDDHWFEGIPGGTRNYFGAFVTMGYIGSYWSSTEGSAENGILRGLNYNQGNIQVFGFYKQNGYSVRCLRD